MFWIRLSLILSLTSLLSGRPLAAAEKTVLLDDLPRDLANFEVATDGSRLYFGHGKEFYVFDPQGRLIDKYGAPTAARELVPLPNGWFVACLSHSQGQLARYRPDGTFAETLVGRGDAQRFRGDMTGWTSPCGVAVDVQHDRMFALDTTMAPRDDRNLPDPDWSRIAVFDLHGKFVGEINAYSAYAEDAAERDDRRTWYEDIEVDPELRRVYVTSRRTRELLVFDYDGRPVAKTASPGGSIAVFPDGCVAVGGGRMIQRYTPELQPMEPLQALAAGRAVDVRDLETDGAGRLYASTHGPDITWLRWSADLSAVEPFGPNYRRIQVEFGQRTLPAGLPLEMRATVEGRPIIPDATAWQVLIRPSDGRQLDWLPLSCRWTDGVLTAETTADLRGLYELAVRFGEGPIAIGDRARDLFLQTTVCFAPPKVRRSLSVFTPSGRRSFGQGEAIPLHVVLRAETPLTVPATIHLEQQAPPQTTLSVDLGELGEDSAYAIPATVTRRLAPGDYLVRAEGEDCESYPLPIHIATFQPDSTMQRIMYHEFGTPPATAHQPFFADMAEEMNYLQRYTAAVHRLGFSRETDRLAQSLVDANRPAAWRRNHAPIDLAPTGLPPAEWLAMPHPGSNWQAEYFLDEASRYGIRYDTHLLGHCDGVRFRDWWLGRLSPTLQATAQWLGRFPAFYGFNYNDEMFFGGWAQGWTQDDQDWLEGVAQQRFPDRPRADVFRHALRVMYDRFNQAVRQANPAAKITTTPMWQFPAVEGSYAPEIYRGMSESYSHYLSEGYHYPWYPAHSAEFLRRPGLPLMGVFDNGHGSRGGDIYAKNVMQVISRGVQGVGVSHTQPFEDPWGADVYRTANRLAQMYGPLLASAPPANEAAILYSYSQDVTERRNSMGTPHWERVFELYGAGLMAGVPMEIVYEEDLAAGYLLADGRPRVPVLFLAGQTQALPEGADRALRQFEEAGGRLFCDADTSDEFPIDKLDFSTHRLKQLFHDGYAADTIFPLFQPVLEDSARRLRQAVDAHLRFPVQTDDPWISKNGFDGGQIRYVALAEETSPFPWDAPTVWSLGAMYCKSQHTYLPKRTRLTLPTRPGVIYDVFDRRRVDAVVAGNSMHLDVDLRHFPGKLYALSPQPLGSPQLQGAVDGDRLHYQVQIVDETGQPLAARVPLRLQWLCGDRVTEAWFRATEADGQCSGSLFIPMTARNWTLLVTEMLGGRSSQLSVATPPPASALVVSRPKVELYRGQQLRELLTSCRQGDEGQSELAIVMDEQLEIPSPSRDKLTQALRSSGVRTRMVDQVPEQSVPGILLVMNVPRGGNLPSPLLSMAQRKGLLDEDVTDRVPGPGRGLITAVFSPRGDREHCIALVGGDQDGLTRTVERFIAWLDEPPQQEGEAVPAELPRFDRQGGPVEGKCDPPLSEQVGVKLSAVRLAGDGRHLLVAAEGYWNNLAMVEDLDSTARVVTSVRAGQSPKLDSLFLGADGKRFGASARTTARFGEALHLFDPRSKALELFPAFGDVGRQLHHFGVSDDGRTVIAAGSYGVVCWKQQADGWKESWAKDYWREFPKLEWPVSDVAARIPQFHAYIPAGADFALLVFGEFSDQGWVKPENFCSARVQAVALADGATRWTFDVPIPKTLLFPTLHRSPAGTRMLLQVQCGSWNQETYRYFSLYDGQPLGSWDTGPGATPLDVALSDVTGRIAAVMKHRLLEIRNADGSLRYNTLWPSQPVNVAFAVDGTSLLVTDDAGCLTMLDGDGGQSWQVPLGCVGYLAAGGERIYVACWDGRLRSFDEHGNKRWTCDLSPEMTPADPIAALAASAEYADVPVWQVQRPSTTAAKIPAGDNLLATGKAKLTVGGTRGWMSEGRLQIAAEQLANGQTDDVETPWLDLDELFWDAQAGRQVWAEISFDPPTDVDSITVYENPRHRQSWPTEGLVQIWNEAQKRWDTAAFGIFLDGPINTYSINRHQVTKLRYLPWNSYYRNFYTSEIEVRSPPALP